MKEVTRFFGLPLGRLWAVLLMAVVVLSGSACVQSPMSRAGQITKPQLSPKLNPFVHFEDGTTLFLAVDVRAAQYIKKGGIFPLGIGLANQSRDALTFTRESFILETSDRAQFPVVSVREFNRDYKRSRSDIRLSDSFREAMVTRFANYNYIDRQLYPFKGGEGTATDSFEMGRLFWTQFYIYFPIPEDGIHGKEFNLLVRPREADETFVVRFALK